jgi:hypothetical protein
VVQTTRAGRLQIAERSARSTGWSERPISHEATEVLQVNGFAHEFVLISGTTARIVDAKEI